MFEAVASESEIPPETSVNPLHQAMDRLLAAVEYRLCVTDSDLDAVARLRFDAYKSTGMVTERPDQMLRDAHDGTPNCYTYSVHLEGKLVGTVRFHLLSAEHPKSPSMDNFPEVLGPRLEMGHSFVDPSRFAADPEVAGRVKALPHLILRQCVAATDHLGVTSCLSLVQGNHGAFYRRVFGSKLIAGPKQIPPLTISAYLYETRREELETSIYRRYPFFRTTRGEAAAILGVKLP